MSGLSRGQGKKADWIFLVGRYNLELNGYCRNDEILGPSRNQKRSSELVGMSAGFLVAAEEYHGLAVYLVEMMTRTLVEEKNISAFTAASSASYFPLI